MLRYESCHRLRSVSDGDQTMGLGQVPRQYVHLHCGGLSGHRAERLGHESGLPSLADNQLQQAAGGLQVSACWYVSNAMWSILQWCQ